MAGVVGDDHEWRLRGHGTLDLDAQPMVELEERPGRELPGQMTRCREQPRLAPQAPRTLDRRELDVTGRLEAPRLHDDHPPPNRLVAWSSPIRRKWLTK